MDGISLNSGFSVCSVPLWRLTAAQMVDKRIIESNHHEQGFLKQRVLCVLCASVAITKDIDQINERHTVTS
jgi:hypothetical protein